MTDGHAASTSIVGPAIAMARLIVAALPRAVPLDGAVVRSPDGDLLAAWGDTGRADEDPAPVVIHVGDRPRAVLRVAWSRDDVAARGSAVALVAEVAGSLLEALEAATLEGRPTERTPGVDDLTGLPGRRRLTAHLQGLLDGPTTDVAVVLLDLDQLDDVNREGGREAGDGLLRAVAGRLGAHVAAEPEDLFLSRSGGDEFVVVASSTTGPVDGRGLATAILATLDQPWPGGVNRPMARASIGLTSSGPGATAEQLLGEAKLGQAEAKHGGGGRIVEVDDALRYASRRRAVVSRELEHAIADGQLRLAYQPQIAIDRGIMEGVEALVRWDHPEWGVVPPVEFIGVAEETGLIEPLGEWVLGEALGQSARWQQRFGSLAPTISINVSARQFNDRLPGQIERAIAIPGVDPTRVCLELTESTVMGDVTAAAATLERLKVLGLRVSIDDFGTGYSSLAHLRRLPIDELKIDRVFVDGLGRRSEDTAIVAAIIAMAHALDLNVVAEGVETEDQRSELHRLGAEMAQGFLFSPGVAPDRISALIGGDRLLPGCRPGGGAAAPFVIIADDAPEVLQLAEVSLTTAGFSVMPVNDGQSVLDLTASVVPSAVILDVSMPDLSGFEVCRRLRADPRTAGCTILMLSSRSASADRIEAFRVGADDYVVKPFTPRDLVARLSGAMRRRQAAADLFAKEVVR